jgi:hypothetical protein
MFNLINNKGCIMSSFKKIAAKHQHDFFREYDRVNIDSLSGREQEHWLNNTSSKKGKNFYEKYEIFEYVNSFRNNKKDNPEWYRDTLRSQHIPFNFFVPFFVEKKLFINVMNELYNYEIIEIDKPKFEYPENEKNPLKDRTSFDVYIEFRTSSEKGFFAIEIKNTEGGYSPTKKEKEIISNPRNIYKTVMAESRLYKEYDNEIIKNNYRQIWRNHLLAYKWKELNKFDRFLSITIYPDGNTHFKKAFLRYGSFLNDDGKKTISNITYEKYFDTLQKHVTTSKQEEWLKYLQDRYLVRFPI